MIYVSYHLLHVTAVTETYAMWKLRCIFPLKVFSFAFSPDRPLNKLFLLFFLFRFRQRWGASQCRTTHTTSFSHPMIPSNYNGLLKISLTGWLFFQVIKMTIKTHSCLGMLTTIALLVFTQKGEGKLSYYLDMCYVTWDLLWCKSICPCLEHFSDKEFIS